MKKLTLILPFILILSMFSAYALDCGFASPSPASAGSLGNLSVLNMTYSNAGTTEANIYFVAYLTSPSTRNATAATQGKIFNVSNNTAPVVMSVNAINNTYPNSAIIEDSSDYTLSCECVNSTAVTACNATRTSILSDRTFPSAPTSITFSNPVKAGDTITATIDRTLANRCFVAFGNVNARSAMTLSGSTCTFTVQSNSPPNSDYAAYLIADDRTNSTLSASQNIIIRGTVSDGGGVYDGQAILNQGQANSGQSILGGSSNPFAPKPTGLAAIPPIGWLLIIIAGFFVAKDQKWL